MLKILTVVGARPQLIKASALSRAIRSKYADQMDELLLHTGQHYDAGMSEVFFEELSLPVPYLNLGLGTEPPKVQLPKMILGIQEVIQSEAPDRVLVYGDTTSTLAGALAAKNEGVPLVHVEAGLRSYQKSMPEEVNRILTDHLASYLFVPTQQAIDNLKKEGIYHSKPQGKHTPSYPAVVNTGDVMLDNAYYFSKRNNKSTQLLRDLDLDEGGFLILTLHRDFNADDPYRLERLLEEILALVNDLQVQLVFPVHPRTESVLKTIQSKVWLKWLMHEQIRLVPPVTYLEMLGLLSACFGVLTDSGGLQKESYFMQKPCLILRESTEWTELLESGYSALIDFSHLEIITSWKKLLSQPRTEMSLYGNGNAAEQICEFLIRE